MRDKHLMNAEQLINGKFFKRSSVNKDILSASNNLKLNSPFHLANQILLTQILQIAVTVSMNQPKPSQSLNNFGRENYANSSQDKVYKKVDLMQNKWTQIKEAIFQLRTSSVLLIYTLLISSGIEILSACLEEWLLLVKIEMESSMRHSSASLVDDTFYLYSTK